MRRLHVMLLAALSGCVGTGEQLLIEPPPAPRVDVELSVVLYADEDSLGVTLGWGAGIPGADVVLTSLDGADPERRLTTDAAGKAMVPELRAGTKYLLTARRLLDATERELLGAASDVFGFVGMDTVIVQGTTRAFTLPAGASRRGSLIISEWSFRHKFTIALGYYGYSGYLELYNASDTTIYLDGIIVGEGFHLSYDTPTHPCSMYDWAKTPEGIWSIYHQAFPGTGRDFPLLPRESVLVATDAIDHRPVSEGLLDLRGADFETTGDADVDNPAVPNMLDLKLYTYSAWVDHGLAFHYSLAAVAFLAIPTDVAGLRLRSDPSSGRPWRLFPRGMITEVFATVTEYDAMYPLCPRLVSETFDRRYGTFRSDAADSYLTSVHRRVLTDTPFVFQDTRSSFVDFYLGPRTPGILPRDERAP